AYREDGITSTVKSFFNDMGQQYRNADLVICRAGATTVAELTAIGKGALLIPYPFAADDHQFLNAKTMSDTGAAEIILQKELSGRSLARKIEYYASNYKALGNMALMAKKLGRPDAAEAIVDDCYRLMKGRVQGSRFKVQG
ncbi:MAG: UDP-N-acetylglucosamine--N-acetylmuramyl-(pentapeptide) pyrophosphoryl-undecaprenol N-acetylglucosamine transferase, partial [Desulfobacterales bacterium]|nr:UDP-N-acetylglucosamine--N-acetylmuramyl-(pentapeptide) pyrophosphoryl-undecaprenol N-acetylglucosamine transferase [Desulfobacterales bacterium]